jgi:hypothetical protein
MTMTITTACTSPLDQPQATGSDRGRGYFWPLTEVQDHHRHGWVGVELSCHHRSQRWRFTASPHPMTGYDNGMISASIAALAGPAWRMDQPVARYSAKAMDAFAAAALAEFRRVYTDGHDGLRALFQTREG